MTFNFTIQADNDTKIQALQYAMENNGFAYFDGYELCLKPTYTSAQYKIAAQDLRDNQKAVIDDEDEVCHEQIQIELLKQGYVAGFEYYCTIECMRKDAEANELADVLEWLAKHDSGIEMTEEDLEYIYYTEWDEE